MVATQILVALVIGFLAGFGFCSLWAIFFAARMSGQQLTKARPR
jgi:hypothetical protein